MMTHIHSQKPASATPLRSSTPSKIKQLLTEATQSDRESTQEEVAFHTNGYNFANIPVNANTQNLEIEAQERLGVVPAQMDNFWALGKKRTSEFNYNLTSKLHQENKTGMPNNLKSGIETLSGMSMDDVKVHYNSSKPLHLQALAYTQGTNIYMASGQEKHLPHEAWHVVQQKQGRVKPTLQMKNTKINDDLGLEKEADQMGAQAMNTDDTLLAEQPQREITVGQEIARVANNETIQMLTPLGDFINKQRTLQEEVIKSPKGEKGRLTTVGFEHEFAQMTSGPLRGVLHLEIAKSEETMPYTDLPFVLETDAQNALELISPPFLIETIPGRPIPQPNEVEKVDNIFKDRLKELVKEETTINKLVKSFNDDGINFTLRTVTVQPENMFQDTPWNVSWWDKRIWKRSIKKTGLKISEKGSKENDSPNISTHVNFATDAQTIDLIEEINKAYGYGDESPNTMVTLFKYTENFFSEKLDEYLKEELNTQEKEKNLDEYLEEESNTKEKEKNLKFFLHAMARTFSDQLAVLSQDVVKKAQKQKYYGGKLSKFAHIDEITKTSKVKDVKGVWVKDTLINIGIGLLNQEQWNTVLRINNKIQENIQGFLRELTSKNRYPSLSQEFINAVKSASQQITTAINENKLNTELPEEERKDIFIGPEQQPKLLSHNPEWIGARQDTYIPARKVQMPEIWEGKRLHVVESRMNTINTLERLKEKVKEYNQKPQKGEQALPWEEDI